MDGLQLTGANGPWLRLRGMQDSMVADPNGAPYPLWSGVNQGYGIAERRETLRQLRDRGFRVVSILEWSPASWPGGIRSGGEERLPLDLKEAYNRCRALARTYGDLIEYWEIENEPDISFVWENAETMVAYVKACSLGLRAGNADRAEARERASASHQTLATRNQQPASSDQPLATSNQPQPPASSLVMSPPFALPPGPYFAQMAANDYLAYVDAFNYHYYGFAEDFGAVRDRWIEALGEAEQVASRQSLGTSYQPPATSHQSPSPSDQQLATRLPIFLTEYGFGLLDADARWNTAGRERQQRWFEKVLPAITDGKITGAMVFVLTPYYEGLINEFGLLANLPEGFDASKNPRWVAPNGEVNSRKSLVSSEQSSATSTQQPVPSDKPLATSLQLPVTSDQPLDTRATLVPVVLDFVSGKDLIQLKRYNGHLVVGGDVSGRSGEFAIVVHQLGDQPVPGELTVTLEEGRLAEATPSLASRDQSLGSSPPPPAKDSARSDRQPATSPPPPPPRVALRSSQVAIPESNWPDANTPIITTSNGETYAVSPALEFLAEAAVEASRQSLAARHQSVAASRQTLVSRPQSLETSYQQPAPSDQSLATRLTFPSNELLATSHLKLTATIPAIRQDGVALRARFVPADGSRPVILETRLFPIQTGLSNVEVERFNFPIEANRETAAALLARPLAEGEAALEPQGRWLVTPGVSVEELPNGWRFTVTDLPPEYLRPAQVELPLPPNWKWPADTFFNCSYRFVTDDPQRMEECETYFRTMAGNLYQVWPRWTAKNQPQSYLERRDNYTSSFFGRANGPWRFTEQQPASLVFMLRPRTLPAVFEITNPRLLRFTAP